MTVISISERGVKMVTGVTLSPKEEKENSMAALERATHKIRMRESKKVAYSSREQITARSNAREKVTTYHSASLGLLKTHGHIHAKDKNIASDGKFVWRGPTGGSQVTAGTQEFTERTKHTNERLVPARKVLKLGTWGW